MCGIVGVLGNHEAAPLLVESLKRMEYRGYDSAGIATVNAGVLDTRRAVGKLVHLSDVLVHAPLAGKTGIGHTRWATHGAATVENAHPHHSGSVAVVHNGIIENFRDLRKDLTAQGYVFHSQTDTETISCLAQFYLDQGKSPEEAVCSTLPDLQGAFAICFAFEGHDDLLIAARKGSPLAIGHGMGEMFIGSDAIALAPMTDRITYLDEGDCAVITRKGATIYNAAGKKVTRKEGRVELDMARIEKNGHRHFMAKEIAEQPIVLANAQAAYMQSGKGLSLPEAANFSDFDRITLVACGTAHYACHVAKYWFEQVAVMPVDIDIASEFRYRNPPLSEKSVAIFVSQSGETADTLAALRYAKGRVGRVLSVINVPTSSIARESDLALPIFAGVEVGVASTKAFTCQLMVLALLALKAAQDKGVLSAKEITEKLADLVRLPSLMNQALSVEPKIAQISKDLAKSHNILFLGRGTMYPLALEGALKLKEISYIHAEAYASGELKHGPIALIDAKVPVIVFAPLDALFDKTVSNMQEVMARHGRVLLVSDNDGLAHASEGCWHELRMPKVSEFLAPIIYAIPAQLLAYHTAVAKGTDVDQPRNLAKSVT
ncbi:MAG: glutamine--fructose-6-phosphate transaminase (isomerizing), partial [Paracoccaceae bacterium]